MVHTSSTQGRFDTTAVTNNQVRVNLTLAAWAVMAILLLSLRFTLGAESGPALAVDQLNFNGQVDQDAASFVLKGRLKGAGAETNEAKLIYSQHSQARLVL